MAIVLNGTTGHEPVIVNRSSGDPDLLLSKFNEIHRYTGAGNAIVMNTLIVEDAVYEIQMNTVSVDTTVNYNFALTLIPNDEALAPTYFGKFITNTINKYPNTVAADSSQSTPAAQHWPSGANDVAGFYFDSTYGDAGINGWATLRLDNRRANKVVLARGGDTTGTFTGIGQWTDATAIWSRVGSMGLYSPSNPGPANSNMTYVINIKRLY
jgi:hypothetical protein